MPMPMPMISSVHKNIKNLIEKCTFCNAVGFDGECIVIEKGKFKQDSDSLTQKKRL
jgi:hypothetical protein